MFINGLGFFWWFCLGIDAEVSKIRLDEFILPIECLNLLERICSLLGLERYGEKYKKLLADFNLPDGDDLKLIAFLNRNAVKPE